MTKINSILILNSLKNSNMFTRQQSFKEYLKALQFRIKEYYGVETEGWGSAETCRFLFKQNQIK